MRFSVKEILSGTFAVAALIIILEHAGAFSQVLESGAGSYATAFTALTGHSGNRAPVASGFSPRPGRRVIA